MHILIWKLLTFFHLFLASISPGFFVNSVGALGAHSSATLSRTAASQLCWSAASAAGKEVIPSIPRILVWQLPRMFVHIAIEVG